MTLRSQDAQKQAAHRVLDEVRAGIFHHPVVVSRALAILGEPVGAA